MEVEQVGGEAPAEAGAPAATKGGEALVSFFTKLPEKFHVQEEPLVVPADLARYGLSEVVNRLLNLDRPVPFDFLIDGEFLRSDLFRFLEARKLSTEKVLRLEYVLALSEPEESQVDEVPDWISSIVALGPLPTRWFAASAFDGAVRVYEGGAPRLTSRLADASITALAALTLPGAGAAEGVSLLAAAGKDGAARACRVSHTGAAAVVGPASALRSSEHRQGLQAVALNEKADLLASAGWDQDILMWNAGASLFAPAEAGGDGASGSSKRKAAGGGAEAEEPKLVLKGHSQVVTGLHFGSSARYPFTLLSTSWDSSVRVWDIAAASCVCNWPVARAVTSFSMSAERPQVATSHEDGHVSFWDLRAPPHATVKGALSLDSSASLPLGSAQSPHRRMASEVKWSPLDSERLASVGHDGCLCLLDVRSPKMPLQRIRLGKPGPVPTKLLCLAWLGREELAVGGSDGKVVRITLGGAKDPQDL